MLAAISAAYISTCHIHVCFDNIDIVGDGARFNKTEERKDRSRGRMRAVLAVVWLAFLVGELGRPSRQGATYSSDVAWLRGTRTW